MKRSIFALALSSGLLALTIGCGNKSTFTSAEDINGEQPDLAVFSVFGENNIDIDLDGVEDSRSLIVVASDNAEICAEIEAVGFDTFLQNAFTGQVEGETVLLFAIIPGTDPFAAETFVGDGIETSIDGGFIVAAGGALVVDTTLSAQDGSLTLDAINENKTTGSYAGNQLFDFATGTDINVGFTGDFAADACQAITDGIPNF